MCKECGCVDDDLDHAHDHNHGLGQPHHHDHHHDPSHSHDHGVNHPATLESNTLSRNDEAAARNRAWLAERGILAVNMISAPGSGKTLLLERTLERLRGRIPCAVITGDIQTDSDARRLQGKGALVRQLETHGTCHLDAERVGRLLPDVASDGAKLLFIENIGNLVCPAAYDLGENFKVALLSTAEGEDKPAKYPALFAAAPVVVLTKTDLIPHLDWNATRCLDSLRRIHPGVYVFELSAKTGQGMDLWIDYLAKLVR